MYVVMRVDNLPGDAKVEDRLSAVAAFHDRTNAEADARLLNELRRSDHSRYFVMISRFKGQPLVEQR